MPAATSNMRAPLLMLTTVVVLMLSQHCITAAAAAADRSSNGRLGGHKGDRCPTLHYKHQCTPKECMWCRNKFSPWPGSDGVCVSVADAWELPSWTYDCPKAAGSSRPGPRQQQHMGVQPTAAAQAGGGDINTCPKLRKRKGCLREEGCVWCKNKWSPAAGNDGVCVDADQASKLPPMAYDCGSSSSSSSNRKTVVAQQQQQQQAPAGQVAAQRRLLR